MDNLGLNLANESLQSTANLAVLVNALIHESSKLGLGELLVLDALDVGDGLSGVLVELVNDLLDLGLDLVALLL